MLAAIEAFGIAAGENQEPEPRLRCRLARAGKPFGAVAEWQNPKTRVDLIPLMRRLGFALQNAPVSLSAAVSRKRHFSQRPGESQDSYTMPHTSWAVSNAWRQPMVANSRRDDLSVSRTDCA